VLELPKRWPWEGLQKPGWSEIDPYHWSKVPAAFRKPLRELASRIEAHSKLFWRYNEFMLESGQGSMGASIRAALSNYFVADANAVSARALGMEGGAVIQLQWIVWGAVPYVLMNPKDSDRAWGQLCSADSAGANWASQVIQALRRTDPATLPRLFDAIERDPSATKARELVRSLHESYGRVVEQATIVRGVLSRRLRIREQ
jgi:hypothetical protein